MCVNLSQEDWRSKVFFFSFGFDFNPLINSEVHVNESTVSLFFPNLGLVQASWFHSQNTTFVHETTTSVLVQLFFLNRTCCWFFSMNEYICTLYCIYYFNIWLLCLSIPRLLLEKTFQIDLKKDGHITKQNLSFCFCCFCAYCVLMIRVLFWNFINSGLTASW